MEYLKVYSGYCNALYISEELSKLLDRKVKVQIIKSEYNSSVICVYMNNIKLTITQKNNTNDLNYEESQFIYIGKNIINKIKTVQDGETLYIKNNYDAFKFTYNSTELDDIIYFDSKLKDMTLFFNCTIMNKFIYIINIFQNMNLICTSICLYEEDSIIESDDCIKPNDVDSYLSELIIALTTKII